MTDRNSDLQRLQGDLSVALGQLRSALDAATTAPQIQAIAREIVEVDHRITIVGGLIFHEKSEKIAAAVKKVADAKTELNKAIKNNENITTFITTVTAFLGLVDKAIDTAKLL